MSFANQYFEDSDNGGLFHLLSEDFSKVIDADKHVADQFNAARTYVIGAMISHDPETIADAEKVVNEVMERFEDKTHGGFFLKADRKWQIIDKSKSLTESDSIFGILMHLYEISKNDTYLLKAIDFLDILCAKAWDNKHGGFFSLYKDNWDIAQETKGLAAQAAMLQHMGGAWKDGVDSPYGARAAAYKQKAESLAALILEKAWDKKHGGFFTSFSSDWKPLEREKDVGQIASLALTLYFHYHNQGPSVWGPRRGSHAYTGRPYPMVYSYRGPAPNIDPVSESAYQYGKKVVESVDLIIDQGWDRQHGGFYTKLTEDLKPADDRKLIATQISCLMALNVAYRLTGFKRFQEKAVESVKVIEDRCFDEQNGGVYAAFTSDWKPLSRDKLCEPNLMVNGILSMLSPIVNGVDVTRNTLLLRIDQPVQQIKSGQSAHFTVTIQHQGFEPMKLRVGGLNAPARWMEPSELFLDLAPHEVKSYKLKITPPADMPAGVYYFEITAIPVGEVAEYVPAGGKIIIK